MSLKLEIVDNFLSDEDLQLLQSLKLKETKDGTMNVYVKKINGDGMISGTGIEDILQQIYRKFTIQKPWKF